MQPLSHKDLLTIEQLSPDEIRLLLATAAAFKARPQEFSTALAGLSIALIFEKPSLRTRLTFEVGAHRLGAQVIYYDHKEQRIGAREATKDYARNLQRWVHGIVARTFEQRTIEELAHHADIPVINALSNTHHPCQALADMLTLTERFGDVSGHRIAFVGDGNNVCHSLIAAATKLGMHATAITPRGYEPEAEVIAACRGFASRSGGSISVSNDLSAVKKQQAIYTDEWASMHHQDDADRVTAFRPYQVNDQLMSRAAPGAFFMHCLPAARGQEVTDSVIDSPQSLVYDQAENRMHIQNALLLHTVGTGKWRYRPATAPTITVPDRKRPKKAASRP